MRAVIVGCLGAAVAWFAMFSPWTAPHVRFWVVMFAAAGLLTAYALIHTPRAHLRRQYRWRWRWLPIGLAAAGLLYGVFFVGNWLARAVLPATGEQIAGVYAIRSGAELWVIGLGLLLWIGPAEEIFWRGFVQDRLMRRLGPAAGFLLATAVYTAIHIWSFNPMLLLAAGLCGLFWGGMYLAFRNVWPGIISHALWDVLIFVLAPVGPA